MGLGSCERKEALNQMDAGAVRALENDKRRYRPFKAVPRAWLARPFSAGDKKRVLLVHVDDKIAWPQFYPFFHYAQRFADMGYVFRTIAYPASGGDRLIAAADAIFLQASYRPAEGEIERVLEHMRALNADAPISFFDWFAPTDIRFADRVADHVSLYAKKALLRDRSYYAAPQRAHTSLEHHYSLKYGLVPDVPTWKCRPDIVDRLILAPGFATAPALTRALEQRDTPPHGERPIDVHARFAVATAQLHQEGRVDGGERTHWYVVMRQSARDAVQSLAERYRVAWKGSVPGPLYMAEMKQSKLCFSPFGFGELCWRDIEAVVAGAVLVKPSMEHLESLCDIYRPGETYAPVRWDFSDLEETVARLTSRPDECRAMAERAYAALRDYLSGPKLGRFLEALTTAQPKA